ncbi:MAG: Unknown protein [uncultured Thiotrichaceae bacterium]|uniref:Cadherin domain-containing protein n=1 Tax=uncultured Thiotrichaceae bacterium TaxID=298394 RepID=A0A6S6T6L6_9GAMM|nr:MAG: Unknown protein [uncultured Thiotrichaceae bacterium]
MPMYSSIKSLLVLLFAFIFLTACGGGGGSTTPTSSVTPVAPKVTIDATTQSNVSVVNGVVTVTASESGVGAGRLLASFDIPAGDSPVTSVVLVDTASGREDNTASRSAASYFDAVLSEDGSVIEVRVKSGEDATPPPGTYKVTLVVTNQTGGEQSIETVIVVSDVAEPVIAANQTFSVSEAAASDAAVGTLTITNDDSAVISSITLTDTVTQAISTDFASNNEGKITVLSTASLDFETTTSYTLSAIATSDGGASNAVELTITITDAADDAPEVTEKDYKVLAGRVAGTVIATLEFDRGSSDVTFELGGADAGNFTLDNNGVLTLNTTATAGATYTLTATATNSNGSSDAAAINVVVIAAPSYAGETPTLMAIGDSITQGKGGKTEAVAAADIATAQTDLDVKTVAATTAATADTNAGAAVNALGVDADTPDFTAAAAAAIAAETNAAGTAAETATATAKAAIEAAAATPADVGLLATARADAAAAKTATEGVLTTANTAKADAETAYTNAKTADVQRFSYRKELGELRDNDTNVSFTYIGSAEGPRNTSGAFLFSDNKHEGHSGFRIRQIFDVAAEYTCTQERFDNGACSNLNGAITGGPHPDAGNTEGKSYLQYSLEDLGNVPDVALVMLGTNDMAFRTAEGDAVAIAKADMEGLIAMLRESNPEMTILLGKIPPMDDLFGWGVNTASVVPFNNELQAIVNADAHATSQLYIVDHYTDFQGSGVEVDPIADTLHVGDGVHPNMAGEAEIAENWLQALQPLFTP